MENKNRTGFINAYNFIPFSGKKAPKYIDKDRHTGVIKFDIQTKTPLFIPNTSNADSYSKDSEDKAFDFYSYANLKGKTDFSKEYGNPVIPGSEIRGMVRSIYETLTSSCMNVLNMDKQPVKRTGEIFAPGLIQKIDGSYRLMEAEDCIFQKKHGNPRNPWYENTWETTRFREGQFVYFKKVNRSEKGEKNIKPLITELFETRTDEHPNGGYLIKGEKSLSGKKHNAHVFIPTGKTVKELGEKSLLAQKDIDGLFSVIKAYQEQPGQENNYQEYERELRGFIDTSSDHETFFPVYYSCIQQGDERLIYLSPASITKEISNHCIADLVSEFMPCNKIENCCPACDLFGMVGENHGESQASKIRFCDASIIRKPDMYYNNGNPVTLPELASPKLGNTEFYLKRPEGAYFWTYDYYLSGEGQLFFYTPELMGRKFYWNQPDMVLPDHVTKTKRNITARLVNRNMVFKGELYFDNISQKQLHQLLWILNCGNRKDDEKDIVFKLGAGKPLGLGSVKLTVTEVRERNLQIEDGQMVYVDKDVPEYMDILSYEENGFDTGCKTEFLNMVFYEKMRGYTICYPITSVQKKEYDINHTVPEGFRWFGENHLVYPRIKSEIQYDHPQKKMAQDRRQNYIVNSLPSSKDITTLPYHVAYHSDEGKTGDSDVLVGKVVQYSDDFKRVNVILDNGKYYWLHVRCFSRKLGRKVDLRSEFPVNTYIRFRDLGKSAEGFKVYEFVSSERK